MSSVVANCMSAMHLSMRPWTTLVPSYMIDDGPWRDEFGNSLAKVVFATLLFHYCHRRPLLLFVIFTRVTELPSVLWCCCLGIRESIQPVRIEWWGAGMLSVELSIGLLHMYMYKLSVMCICLNSACLASQRVSDKHTDHFSDEKSFEWSDPDANQRNNSFCIVLL